jgi:hypothetical protein
MSEGVVITPGLPPEQFVVSMGTRIIHRPRCRFVTVPGSARFPFADAEAVDSLPACRVCIPSANKRRPARAARHEHSWGPWRRVAADGGSPASRNDEDYVGLRRSCDCGAFEHRHKETERAE